MLSRFYDPAGYRFVLIAFGGLAVVLSLTGAVSAQNQQAVALERAIQKDLALARKYIDAGRPSSAKSRLLALSRRVGDQPDARVEAMLAECLLADRRPDRDQAYERIKPFIKVGGDYSPERGEEILLVAAVLEKLDKHREALALYDWLAAKATRTDGDYGNPHGAQGALAIGRVLIAMKDYQKAVQALEFARKYMRQHFKDYAKEEPYKTINAQIDELLAKAKRLRDIELYGEDFLIYREAETLRRKNKKYDAAIKKYQDVYTRFPEGPYADACRMYECLALIATEDKKKVLEAEKKLQQFIKDEPKGLYRGEAMLELGRIALEWRVSQRLGEKQFKELDEWITEVRQDQAAVGELAIKEAAKKFTAPPKSEYKEKDFWGNVDRAQIKPGQLVNRQTSEWYLNQIEEECAKWRGFLHFVAGNNKAAKEHYDRLTKLDPRMAGGDLLRDPNDHVRLSHGLTLGYLYAYPEELRLYRGDARLAVLLIDFYYVTERFRQAHTLAGRLADGQLGRMTPAQMDYIHFIRGASSHWFAGHGETVKHLQKVLETEEGTLTEQRAAYGIGNAVRHSNNKELRELGLSHLKELMDSPKQNEFTWKAHHAWAIDLYEQGQKAEAIEVWRKMPQDAGMMKSITDHYVERFSKEIKSDESLTPEE